MEVDAYRTCPVTCPSGARLGVSMRGSGGGDGNRVWLEWRAFCCLKKRCFLFVSYVNVHWIPDETGQVKGRRLAHQQSVEEMWAFSAIGVSSLRKSNVHPVNSSSIELISIIIEPPRRPSRIQHHNYIVQKNQVVAGGAAAFVAVVPVALVARAPAGARMRRRAFTNQLEIWQMSRPV